MSYPSCDDVCDANDTNDERGAKAMTEPHAVTVTIERQHEADSPFTGMYRETVADLHLECASGPYGPVPTLGSYFRDWATRNGEAWNPCDAIGDCDGCEAPLADEPERG